MTSSELPSELPEQPLQEPAQSFDYAALNTETRIVVQQRTSEIKERLRDTAQATWEIGQKLVDVRNRLEYGQFNLWIITEFRWSRSTAYNYINVFESFGSCPKFGQLDIALNALYILAAPSTPEAAREEALERAHEGEAITTAKAKAIANHHKGLARVSTDSELVTVDITAETIEKESNSPAEAEPGEYTEQNQPPTEEEGALLSEVIQNYPDDADQSEQELLGKEVETESSLPEISRSNLTRQLGKVNEPTGSKNKGEKKMERQQVHEVYKNLRANINYIVQENIFEEIDLEDLKSLEQEIALLVKRKEASLNKHYNSNYSNN